LIVDVGAQIGEDGRFLCDRPYEALSARLLITLEAMIDEVGGEQLL
jgi:hypothetical protein